MRASVFLLLLIPAAASSVSAAQAQLPGDCEDVFRNISTHSGVYTIYPAGLNTPAEVYCDMGCDDDFDNDRGMWTVIQRRMDGTVNFYRPWDHYRNGFGNISGEHWLGLETIYLLTSKKKYELWVDLEDFERGQVHALYASFSIDSESEGYKLHLGSYVDGGAGNSMAYHNEMRFTTFDKDQDNNNQNCAVNYLGGFWYNNCHYVNPNGLYMWGEMIGSSPSIGVVWEKWKGMTYSLKSVTMKIRPQALEKLKD